MLDINGRVGSVWPQSGVTLSVSSPSGCSNGFGTLPHQAEIGFKQGCPLTADLRMAAR